MRVAGGLGDATYSEEESKRMRGCTYFRKLVGNGAGRNTAQITWKQEGHGGFGQTNNARYSSSNNTLKRNQPHERPLEWR